jgi:phosphomannomutase
MHHHIEQLMQKSGVKFGTSGARGLVSEMTDEVCYTYTKGFLQYLEDCGELKQQGENVVISGDLRPSTNNIIRAVAKAIHDMGYEPIDCGRIPSPAIVLYGLELKCPSIMVTGSHIPEDRNGIKFNKCSGEILKSDEPRIMAQRVERPQNTFDSHGKIINEISSITIDEVSAHQLYIQRYLDTFPVDCLKGKSIGVYQHSAVGRDTLVDIFTKLGATVVSLGRSETFVPVDTEAIRPKDTLMAKAWAQQKALDCIVSTDGDSDRPLISDERGTWLRGDVLGIIVSQFLQADVVCAPVNCNTALEKSGAFTAIQRTQIGSPHVVKAMMDAADHGYKTVVGYEANGGFLTQSDLPISGKTLKALPTRDAVLPILCIVLQSIQKNMSISKCVEELPQRVTLSERIQNIPTEQSSKLISSFYSKDGTIELKKISQTFIKHFGEIESANDTDGLRITFKNQNILHMRPSGNAPEFRFYNESINLESAQLIQKSSAALIEALL